VLVLVILVVLSALTVALSLRIKRARRRQDYMMDYQRVRYACDSALKYMFNVMPDQNFKLISREGIPDFSDLFWMDKDEYEAYILYWLETADEEQIIEFLEKYGTKEEEPFQTEPIGELSLAGALGKLAERIAEPNEWETESQEEEFLYVDPNQIRVVGPYEVDWPYVIEPIELEIGPVAVTITVEDENAKMPLGWAATNSKAKNGKMAQAALKRFCEWMSMEEYEIEELQAQCEEIQKHKTFVVDPKPILLKSATSTAASKRPTRTRFRTTRTKSGKVVRTPIKTPTSSSSKKDELRPAIAHATDFSKLFHSSLFHAEDLARPRVQNEDRDLSPLRYLALWGSQEVNINTAPRHVLEAAFMFAGEPEAIAEAIIEHRKTKPFTKIDELKKLLPEHALKIKSAEPYITTTSSFFQIRVTSRCGNARCAAVAAVFKDKKKVMPLAVLYGR